MFKESSEPIDAFRLSDTQDLIAETLKAFCLSLNSIWERQLRNLMTGVARELYDDPGLIKKCQMDPWHKLAGLFEELRGFKLSAFKAYDDLDTLQLLANVCRHGEGASLQRLSTKCPELWLVPDNSMTALLDMPEPKRVSDLLCMSNSVHASLTKEHEDNDDYEGSIRRAAEGR